MLKKFLIHCSALVMLSGMALAADPPKVEDQEEQDNVVVAQSPDLQLPAPGNMGVDQFLIGGMPGQATLSANVQTLGEFWIGVESQPVMPVLRVHLNLPENQGIVVNSVLPDSPAAKAGIEQHDILMAAGDVKLSSAQELAKVVTSAKETPIKLSIIHAGKPKTIEVTPEKSPQDILRRRMKQPDDMDQIEQWMQSMQGGAGGAVGGGSGSRRITIMHNPLLLPPGVPNQPQLPGNMSISVNRNGDKPANIVVKWNDKEWKINEKELDQLPAEVRPHVERMLRPGPTMTFPGTMIAEPLAMPMPGPNVKVAVPPTIEQQLEEMNRKIEAMQKLMLEQQKRLLQSAPAEKEESESEDK
jgi:hypothetical protein